VSPDFEFGSINDVYWVSIVLLRVTVWLNWDERDRWHGGGMTWGWLGNERTQRGWRMRRRWIDGGSAPMSSHVIAPLPLHPLPDFRTAAFLRRHWADTLRFYTHVANGGRGLEDEDEDHGGFHQSFADDGRVFDRTARHLVSSTRFIVQFAWARSRLHTGDSDEATVERERDVARVLRGIEYLRTWHRDPTTGGYCWTFRHAAEGAGGDARGSGGSAAARTEVDGNVRAYGLAFVVLAYASALEAGVEVSG